MATDDNDLDGNDDDDDKKRCRPANSLINSTHSLLVLSPSLLSFIITFLGTNNATRPQGINKQHYVVYVAIISFSHIFFFSYFSFHTFLFILFTLFILQTVIFSSSQQHNLY